MDRILYTAMSGAKQSMDQQAVVSHNLSNVSTSGFRAQLHAMRAVPVQGDGVLPTRVSVAATTPGSDFSQGPITQTGRELDVALEGDAWLAVQADDGSEAYTRRGDLQVDGNGLVTVVGRPVIGEGGPLIVPLGSSVTIGADGTLSAIGEGEGPEALVDVGRLKLVTPQQSLQRGDDGLFRVPPNAEGEVAALEADEEARLASGALEGSNVSAVEAMVAMIDVAKRYEMQMKAIKTADENAQRANNLLSIQG
ncbi:flagellar basal body rod protein FlgF [Halomonas sp. MCCC 1A17488]|uniref:Flagellar basal-body rod protein FlgF n=1 Tax=Billgrantia sulfidoxydans TaxID=2733484 RepID=A0ABX7W4U4_9GAMM|nr:MULTISPECIES: flagellar basal body rod protein FlgF [Halomonas]MCE8014781.1 flagellar basal body rod protein FlgF [Halomonas sp. MCCC 1A17488]MCG3238114.1 flagellar basal body rod protein FlgF [Halomonas sp. MCCC 1A17488]QPP48115.1 flagellar basal body rod protein FlgF [Halomonas sp. SS10-MC5]QTP55404.1 flagellar basal body rod protein FlgF [Halomonas sulfidoxydans]